MIEGKRLKSVVFYIFMLVLFSLSIYFTIDFASSFSNNTQNISNSTISFRDAYGIFAQSVEHHVHSTIGMLLLQILVILSIARLLGLLFAKMKQPVVIGEIIAGILLGPTLLGSISPETYKFLFPAESVSNIQLLSNFGLILFMFVIGMELRISDIKEQFSKSLIISHTGIFIPFSLSLLLSYYIYQDYAASQTGFIAFALFIGISMSITAFPVLARIIQENHLSRKPLGKLALSSAAMGDISAWLMLASIIAIADSGSMMSTIYNLGFLIVYILIMFGVLRPLFSVIGKYFDNNETINHTLIGVIFVLLLLSSYITEILSMHALFGAFIFGLIMPEDISFRKIVTDKIEDVSLLLFLPLFFVSSGLQTELGLISTTDEWILFGIFTFIAIFGKVFGTYISARVVGESPKDSIYLGAFMNTRGLMELVVLSIGYQLNILPANIYAILVLMTIVTTVITMPMISLINQFYKLKERYFTKEKSISLGVDFKVLLAFARPKSGANLLKTANNLLKRGDHNASYTALHITTDDLLSSIDMDKYYEDSFSIINNEADRLSISLDKDYQVSGNAEHTIIQKLKKEQFNMLLIGAGIKFSNEKKDVEANKFRDELSRKIGSFMLRGGEKMLSVGSMIQDKSKYFFENSPCSVSVLISRSSNEISDIAILMNENTDHRMLSYARSFADNNKANLTVYASKKNNLKEEDFTKYNISLIEAKNLNSASLLKEINTKTDFLIMDKDLWYDSIEPNDEILEVLKSTLIMNLK